MYYHSKRHLTDYYIPIFLYAVLIHDYTGSTLVIMFKVEHYKVQKSAVKAITAVEKVAFVILEP